MAVPYGAGSARQTPAPAAVSFDRQAQVSTTPGGLPVADPARLSSTFTTHWE